MSLFLSKLLPLFFYPLGFACLMLVLALVSLWKRRWRPRWTAGYITLALLALLLGGNGAVARQLTYSLEQQYVPATLPNAGAIVVLGGGIRSQFPPRPWIDVTEAGDRPIYAAALYKQGKAPLVILSGGRIDWLGGGPPESADMAKLVEALGVPASAILQDPTSLNTRENAVNVKQILDARGIQQILLVTSATHMPRSMRIFQKLGVNAVAAPTDFLVVQPEVELAGNSAEGRLLGLIPDSENLHHSTRALKEYIGSLVYQLRGWI